MPSFDVVSEVDLQEVRNAVDQANREIGTRFDFKGVDAAFELGDGEVALRAEQEFQLGQMMDILRQKLVKRKVDVGCMDIKDPETSLNAARQRVVIRQGIETDTAKRMVKAIKGSKIKVQAQIQGEQLRVNGKKRDDLQQVIAMLREADYGLPLRASNACAANCPDSQSAWESAFSLWSAVSARVNVVYHAAGWLEGGLCASYEKFVMDCETLQQIIAYLEPVTVTEDEIAFEAVKEVGPGGHFFGAAHTQERYETAFYSPFLSDWSNFENWQERGSVQTPERANKVWKQILKEFEAPPLDPAIDEELQAFVAKRKEEGGAPTDY